MQHRYVGDIGDYVKLGALRALSSGFQLGVAWWLFPDEAHNKDGRHVEYLANPKKWRTFDPELFDALKEVVDRNTRHVSALEAINFVPGTIFSNDALPVGGAIHARAEARRRWFQATKHALRDANLIFVDPDNGLQPNRLSLGRIKAGKSVLFEELRELSCNNRCLVVYHHQTRRKGGHAAEIDYWADMLRQNGFQSVDALRACSYSPRVFFLLNAPEVIRDRAKELESNWREVISWHPDRQTTGPK